METAPSIAIIRILQVIGVVMLYMGEIAEGKNKRFVPINNKIENYLLERLFHVPATCNVAFLLRTVPSSLRASHQ